jgi:hypothetical protein
LDVQTVSLHEISLVYKDSIIALSLESNQQLEIFLNNVIFSLIKEFHQSQSSAVLLVVKIIICKEFISLFDVSLWFHILKFLSNKLQSVLHEPIFLVEALTPWMIIPGKLSNYFLDKLCSETLGNSLLEDIF